MNPIHPSAISGISVLSKIALLTLLGISASHATTYYVAPTGNNTTNTGTLSSPWKTIRFGASQLHPGDTLYVRGGMYSEIVLINVSGNSTAPITISSYPGEYPVIDGSAIADSHWQMLVSLAGSYINMSGIEVRNCNMQTNLPYPNFPSGGYGVQVTGQHNRLTGLYVHYNRSVGILVAGSHNIVEYCKVSGNCQDNNTPPNQHQAWGNGLSIQHADNAIARHNTVFNNWGEGIDSFESNHITIEDNTVYDNFSVNLYVSDSQHVLVQRNLVYASSNPAINGNPSTITLADENPNATRSSHNKIINNFLYGSRFEVFYWNVTPCGLDNVLIANNTLVNGQLQIGTTYLPNNTNSFVRNNIFDNPAPVAAAHNTTGITFSNNAWSGTPPAAIAGTGDVIGNLQIAKTGVTTAGNLNSDYFKIAATSPAVNQGTTLPGDNDYDFFNHPRVAPVDIGGHETDSVPSPWLTQDIGAVSAPGSASYAAPAFLVTGSGSNIWDTADEFRYVYQASSGDCTISAQVVSQQATDPYSKAGLMIREDLTAGSRYVALLITPGNGLTLRWRPTANGICSQASYITGVTAPRYLKLVRSGTSYTAFYSANGSTWTAAGSTPSLSFASNATFGLAVASDLDGALSAATFDNVIVSP